MYELKKLGFWLFFLRCLSLGPTSFLESRCLEMDSVTASTGRATWMAGKMHLGVDHGPWDHPSGLGYVIRSSPLPFISHKIYRP